MNEDTEQVVASSGSILPPMHEKCVADLWLTGFSRDCLLAFTTHRLFLLGIKGVSSAKKALANPQENISVMVCDLGNRERVSKGSLLIPRASISSHRASTSNPRARTPPPPGAPSSASARMAN